MYSSTSTKELSVSLFMCFRIFKVGHILMIFCGDENFKYFLYRKINVYRYSNFIKTDNYFRKKNSVLL